MLVPPSACTSILVCRKLRRNSRQIAPIQPLHRSPGDSPCGISPPQSPRRKGRQPLASTVDPSNSPRMRSTAASAGPRAGVEMQRLLTVAGVVLILQIVVMPSPDWLSSWRTAAYFFLKKYDTGKGDSNSFEGGGKRRGGVPRHTDWGRRSLFCFDRKSSQKLPSQRGIVVQCSRS